MSRSVTHSEARQGAQSYLNSRLENGRSVQSTGYFVIPNIDIGPSFSSSAEARKAVAQQIRAACTSSGFFYITGHRVPEPIRLRILTLAARFFKLPWEIKEAIHIRHSEHFRGWENAEYTHTNPADWTDNEIVPETKEGFNWGYEVGLDPTGGDGNYVELDGKRGNANEWPSEEDVPGFYATIREYYGEMLNLARHLMRLFALSLELPQDYFDSMLTHPGGIGRLLYYPAAVHPQPLDPHVKDKEIGLGAHTDYECFTILLSSSAPGLEILSPENVWVQAPTVERSFIINVADFLMRWTNDAYKSTIHRVVNRTRESRYSVPFFFAVNYDQMIETLPSCIDSEHPSKYAPIRAGEYILERLRATTKEQ